MVMLHTNIYTQTHTRILSVTPAHAQTEHNDLSSGALLTLSLHLCACVYRPLSWQSLPLRYPSWKTPRRKKTTRQRDGRKG